MPSPIGHGLASLIIGAPQRRGRLALALVGMAPDLDLLWGRHGMEAHSVGAAFLAALVAFAFTRDRRTAVIVGLVWFAHPVLDALGEDSSAPYGVMLWWPFSHAHYIAPFHIFDSIYRAYWKSDFWTHNAVAAVKEVAILGPLLALAWWWRRREIGASGRSTR
jgi:inner membrane protein